MDRNTEQAIDWLITLDSGRVSETERQAFEFWLHQSPFHAQAWALLQQRLSRSEDAAEGVRSFVERRAARFQGR